jgi:hypothetical protein
MSERVRVVLVAAGTLAHEWRAPLDKRGREDTIFVVLGPKAHGLGQDYPYGSSPVERSSAMDMPPRS